MLNTRQTFNHIMAQIQEFEDSLDDDKEVSVLLTSFGPALLMNVTGIGFMNPDLVFFYGTGDGRPSGLIQNISQLNFLLTSAEKEDPEEPPRKIGFTLPDDLDEK